MKKLDLQDILENTQELKEKKVWFIAIIWRPNAWKSTFVNSLIWKKISITTNIPQTTRKKVLAIYNDNDSQIIFFDTPWIHKSEKLFNEEINSKATGSLKDADKILYFIDSTREWWVEEDYIKDILSKVNVPVLKIYTKSDLPSRINIPSDWIKISSETKDWFENLLKKIKENLKTDQIPYPEEYYTSQSIYFRISEIIREKVFLHTKEELPHSIYVWVEELNDKEKLLKIVAYVYTESDSQKYIIIWKWWSLISKIWKEARLELEKVFEKKVFLALRAKVKKWWRKDEQLVKKILN